MLSTTRGILFLAVVAVAIALPSPKSHADTQLTLKSYSVDELKSMESGALSSLGTEFTENLTCIGKIMNRQADDDINFECIRDLERFPVQESLQAAYAILRAEFRRGERRASALNSELVSSTIELISRIGAAMPDNNVMELDDLIEEGRGRLRGQAGQAIVDMLKQARALVVTRPVAIPSLDTLIQQSLQKTNRPAERLKRVESLLDGRIIGQPEVVQALMDLEWRGELYGKARTKPDAIYLIGLPGTGKDTAAEALTDALHGYKGAYHTHMFRLPLLKNKADTWQVLGSATGYMGSDSFPPFLAFLVQHSGGRYKLEKSENTQGKVIYSVVDNPEYHGETLPGYFAPETGVVFVNEFHNWSKQLKDDFIKQALEKGIFHINSPNGGLADIQVPVRFVIASNEGIGLITSREANGQRHGKEMTYEQLLSKWEKIHENKAALRNEILSTNGSRNESKTGESSPGISEELINRIPDRFILLMRPLSPENLRQIVNLSLTELTERMGNDKALLGNVKVSWSENLVRTIQEYDYRAEENARPVLARIGTFVEDPLIDAVKSGELHASESESEIHLDIRRNEDRTLSLVIDVKDAAGRRTELVQLIRATLKDRPVEAISNERIDRLVDVERELKAAVFGIDPILERLAQRIVSIENESAAGSDRPANLIMLTGLSSTGKTETAKQLSKQVNGADDELVTFDFSQIQTLEDFKAKILGLKDAAGNPIPSEFMKHYDRNNGRLIVVFDELANVRDRDLLKSLYDFFREPIVSTFSDGKPRAMGGVTVIITGNAGQELYNQVPADLPMDVQMKTWAEIYQRTNGDYNLQRQILEKYYPEPLITRIGRNNIFFVSPHSYASLRQLAQFKLSSALKRMRVTESRRGWNVVFPDLQEYKDFVTRVIEEGFSLRYQGASIDSFIRDDFEEPLKYLLLRHKVPSGSTVVLKFRNETENTDEENPGFVIYDVYVANQVAPIVLKLRRPHADKPVERSKTKQIVTAYHEAGHSLVRQVLFPGFFEPYGVTILPGVAKIGDQWVYYAGLATNNQQREISHTRDWVVREIAVFAAGETAERLVTRFAQHSAGKRNDMERATWLARSAILHFGLSENWGTQAVPKGVSHDAYVAGLSDKQLRLLEQETQALLKEGRDLAEKVLEANFDTALVPLANQLVEAGSMDKSALIHFYEAHRLNHPQDRAVFQKLTDHWRTRVRKWRNPKGRTATVELDASLPRPKHIADIDAIAAADRDAQFASVALPQDLPIGSNASFAASESKPRVEAPMRASCSDLLEKVASTRD